MGLKSSNQIPNLEKVVPEINGEIPDSLDWRSTGNVSPVKNQGQCGSCWAFSTTGAIEAAYSIAFPDDAMPSLSEQQLVDCAGGEYLNGGCEGGWYYWAYQYARTNAMVSETDYAYTAKDGTCAYEASQGIVTTPAFNCVSDLGTGGLRTAIQGALMNGPSNVAVAAGNLHFQTYTSGILSSTDCPTTIDHAILAVGWGTSDDGEVYYIVKNSWGAEWGLDGYIQILATEDGEGICGINKYVMYPTVAKA